MDPMTGEIHHLSEEDLENMQREHERFAPKGHPHAKHDERMASLEQKLVSLTDDEAEMLEPLDKRDRKGWMRNQPCPCGSGEKFKKCCWSKF